MTEDEKLMSETLETLEFIRRVEDLGMVTDGTAKQNITALRERLAQPVQEPVAWIDEEKKIIYWHNTHATDDYHGLKRTTSLYTDPQPRQWQGLTDKEVDECFSRDPRVAARNAEAKLREKNA